MKRFKTRKKYKITKPSNKNLEKRARKNISKVNARLKKLRRTKGIKSRSYASKILYNKLSIKNVVKVSKTGIINLAKNLTKTALNLIINVTENFLKSKTSTPKGIMDIRENTKKSLFDTLSDINNDVTEEDIDDLYDLFGTDDMDYFVERLGASALEIAIVETKEVRGNEEYFVSFLSKMGLSSDEEMRFHARNIFDKLIR